MPTLYVSFGLPGSGKSTWAARHRAMFGSVGVDIDQIVMDWHGGDYTAYDSRLKPQSPSGTPICYARDPVQR